MSESSGLVLDYGLRISSILRLRITDLQTAEIHKNRGTAVLDNAQGRNATFAHLPNGITSSTDVDGFYNAACLQLRQNLKQKHHFKDFGVAAV